MKNEERISEEKKNGEKQLETLKKAHQARLEEYQKTSEKQFEALQKQMLASSQALHDQEKKSQHKQMELSQK